MIQFDLIFPREDCLPTRMSPNIGSFNGNFFMTPLWIHKIPKLLGVESLQVAAAPLWIELRDPSLGPTVEGSQWEYSPKMCLGNGKIDTLGGQPFADGKFCVFFFDSLNVSIFAGWWRYSLMYVLSGGAVTSHRDDGVVLHAGRLSLNTCFVFFFFFLGGAVWYHMCMVYFYMIVIHVFIHGCFQK